MVNVTIPQRAQNLAKIGLIMLFTINVKRGLFI